jgi:hypothetical protein
MWGPQSQTIQRAFAQGELAPAIHARADLALYTTGLKTCKNFIVRRQGGVVNRPGTEYIATAKTPDGRAWLFPFIFPDNCFLIEAGEFYLRFYKDGARVTVSGVAAWSAVTAYVTGDLAALAGVNYYCVAAHTNQSPPNATYWHPLEDDIFEIPTPYEEGDFDPPAPLCFSQSGSVVTITGLDHAPRELRWTFGSDTAWVLSTITTAPAISAPTSLALSGSPPLTGPLFRSYQVTAIGSDGEESLASSALEFADIIDPAPEDPLAITWTAVSGAAEYRVYCDVDDNGQFGFIGLAASNTFNDTGLAPDFFRCPPQARVLFASTNNYPATNTTYQQRRFFGGTHNDRELVYASRTGYRSNFSIRSPLQDDDALTWKLAAQFAQPVMHMLGLESRLVILTDTGVWLAYGDTDGALIPTRINLDQKGYLGSGPVPPVVVGNRIVYQQARATRLRDLQYVREISGYEGMGSRDLTFLAGHLFEGQELVDLAYAHEPYGVIWAVRDDGVLLGCTYVADDDAWGWHRHTTGASGAFEQVCVLPEGTEDVVYVVVRRQIDDDDLVTIERFTSRQYTDHVDAIHLDGAVTYEGASATAMSGLDHLEGETVYAWTNGTTYQGPFTVTGGAITLTTAATTAHMGLEIEADLEALDLDANGTELRGKRKRVQALALLLEDSRRGFQVGPDEDHLLAHRAETWDTSLVVDGLEEINITAAFTPGGRIFIRHTRPTPLAINALLPVFETGS